MNDDNNIIQFGSISGGKTKGGAFPTNPYVIYDIDDKDYYAEGYLIFTSHHVCIMEEHDDGPVAGLMVPLSRVRLVTIVDDDYEDNEA